VGKETFVPELAGACPLIEVQTSHLRSVRRLSRRVRPGRGTSAAAATLASRALPLSVGSLSTTVIIIVVATVIIVVGRSVRVGRAVMPVAQSLYLGVPYELSPLLFHDLLHGFVEVFVGLIRVVIVKPLIVQVLLPESLAILDLRDKQSLFSALVDLRCES
jgi:hypothetical protein